MNLEKAKKILQSFHLQKTEYHDRYSDARDFERFFTKTFTSEKYPGYKIEMLKAPWGIDRNPPVYKLYQNNTLLHIEFRKTANLYNIAQMILGEKDE